MGTDYAAIFFIILFTVATSIPLGRYMARVFQGERTLLDPVLGPIERFVLRISGVDPRERQDWKQYARSLLISNVIMWLATFAVVSLQKWLPINPDGIANMEPTLAFNTISSFTTNTNLQDYSGETGLSYFSQMFVITFLQFVTAATGVAACVAIIRGLGGNRLEHLGNFYVDVTRASVRVFLPLSLLVGALLLWQGTPMTFEGAAKVTTLEGQEQVIARGVVAPEVAIKQLGTNGGGYFGPNSAHPYENPTPISNLIEAWSITVIPMAMVWTLGSMLRRRRLAVVIFLTMLLLYLPMVVFGVAQEAGGNPAIAAMGVDQSAGSMEGKEVRFGAGLSAFWAVTTTVTSNGSVDSMHDSMTPLGGLMPMIGMWLNNIFGGVGVGFINMLIFIIVAVFVAGMMIGRTPEFLGKKVEAKEVKLASLALLWHPLAILVGTAIACHVWATTADPNTALAWLKSPGPHGFSEMLYQFSSAAANNGSGFEGLGDNTPFWNISTGLVMLLSRYIPIIAPLALAGLLAAKPAVPETAGSLRADTALFGFMLGAVIITLGLLMFMPVAVLGPIAEHLSRSDEVLMIQELKRGLLFTLVTMLLFGGGYHLALWAVGRLAFPGQAEGSLIRGAGGELLGSRLIAQKFERPEYFHPRPSGVDYNAASTGGTNYGPANPDHLKAVRARLDAVTALEGVPASRIPSELVTASGSGMDPHIPPDAADLQVERVAAARGVDVSRVRALVARHIEPPTLGFLGRARINVLELNLALDRELGPKVAAAPAERR